MIKRGSFLAAYPWPWKFLTKLNRTNNASKERLSHYWKCWLSFFCGAVYDAVQGGSNFFNLCRAVATFFVTGGGGGGEGAIIASAEGTNLVVGSGCILPQKILNMEASKRYFQHLSWDMSTTIIKISESKENKSIHRLDVSIPTGPRGAAAPLTPPLATALLWMKS